MKEILLNESYKQWLIKHNVIIGIESPQELNLALLTSWLEHVGIFVIPERSINGWVCKIEDIGLVQLSPFNNFPIKKTRSEAIEHAFGIVNTILI